MGNDSLSFAIVVVVVVVVMVVNIMKNLVPLKKCSGGCYPL